MQCRIVFRQDSQRGMSSEHRSLCLPQKRPTDAKRHVNDT